MSLRLASAFLTIALLCFGQAAHAQDFITNNDPRNPVQVDLSILNEPPPEQAAPNNPVVLEPPTRALKFRNLTRPALPAVRPIPAIDKPKPPSKPVIRPAPPAAIKTMPVEKPAVAKSIVTVPPNPGHKPALPPTPVAKPAPSLSATKIESSPVHKTEPDPVSVAPTAPIQPKPEAAPVLPPPVQPAETKPEIVIETPPEAEKPVVAPQKPEIPLVPKAPVKSTAGPIPPPDHKNIVKPDAQSAFISKTPKMVKAEETGQNLPKPVAGKDKVRLKFDSGTSDLNAEAASALDSVIASLNESDKLRLQLLAYAQGTQDSASSARRLALSRALAVRAYLMDHNIRPTRVDVRAMGSETQEQPLDRVDVIFIE